MATQDGLRIFLAGASGHTVGGMTRSAGKLDFIAHLGAEPILCDGFDREALFQAVRDFEPNVILNELTDLPDDVANIGAHAELNARIRTEGNQNRCARPRASF
jgi:hypothetical protein